MSKSNITIDILQSRLRSLVKERQGYNTEIEALGKKVDDLNSLIILELSLAGEKSARLIVDDQEYTVYMSQSDGKDYLVRIKLVEAGVTNEQLERGTSKGKGYTSVTVKKIGKDGKEKD